ncbi:kinase [Gallaecimonas mangrovi]|uniref:kinase n=1 Tax=Gallaecimonas mangrovi TaxID=2291597 RepID=UPI000E203FBF|nr:kinase [Gallaecimonas mangrovi]
MHHVIQDAIQAHRLPENFQAVVNQYYLPLAENIIAQSQQSPKPLVVGVTGAQGTGKSTLADFLAILLKEMAGLKVAVLSLDDLYLTRAERLALADSIHPLLKTRGVPGTHDVTLGQQVLDTLAKAHDSQHTPLPRFDKSIDDRAPQSDWPTIQGRPDVVILEGWCLGAGPQEDDAVSDAINSLEAEEDHQGHWRRYVNEQLKGPYRDFFDKVQFQVFMRAPSMEAVQRWRQEQEHKLKARVGAGAGIMSDEQIVRFIQHYERLTRHLLATHPKRTRVRFELADDHSIKAVDYD